jgi:hypothetical protein
MDLPKTRTLADSPESGQLPPLDSETVVQSRTQSHGSASLPVRQPFSRIPDYVLIFLALFALAWAIARACLQAVTGDEGEAYVMWVADPQLSHWFPSPNNHLLNTILAGWFTSIFGLSAFTVRAPSLLGAALYIVISLWFTRLFTEKWIVRLPLFIGLVYNPFVFDYFVAARGYALATAFLLCAIAVPAWCYLKLPNVRNTLIAASVISSICLALSFTANFSFAFIDAAAFLLLLFGALYSARQCQPPAGRRLEWQLLAANILPGALVVLLLPSWTLLHWQPGFLFAGGTSLRNTFRTVVEASLYQLNPQLANPIIYAILNTIKPLLIPALCGLAVLQLVLILFGLRKEHDEHDRRLLTVGAVCFGAVAISLFMHRAAYSLFRLLMPEHRTALFVAPLLTLTIGVIASIRPRSRASTICRGALLGTLSLTALYFVMCLRLTHFKEWQYQEDVKDGYDVVAWYNHNRGVENVEVSWYYYGALRFYRALSGREAFASFTNSGNLTHPVDRQLYVLNGAFERDFINAQKLKVVYHGPRSDLVVAIRPDLEEPK